MKRSEINILDHEGKTTPVFGFRDLDCIFFIPERRINVKRDSIYSPSPDYTEDKLHE